MTTQATQTETGSTLKAFEAKVLAQMKEAEARIEKFEARAKEKRLQAEVTAVNALKTARQNIEHKLKDLSTMQETQIARAKSDIDAAAAAL
jgi:acetyl-CoA carboxylase alpha subunit